MAADIATGVVIALTLALVGVGVFLLKVSSSKKQKSAAPEDLPGPVEHVEIRKSKEQPVAPVQALRKSASQSQVDLRNYKKVCLACGREFRLDFEGKCPDDGVEPSKIADYFAPGSRFSEYYEIEAPLGTGGLSRVFKARHITSARNVAIKLLHSHLCQDELSVQRFQREARALSKLSHPNLVAVDDFMISPDGVPFIVMDLIEGESLKAKLKRETVLPWMLTVTLFIQVCKGLSHAHERGIIHRDLKPGNIMILPAGDNLQVKVVDFGLAKDENSDSMNRLTGTGDVFGSPKYMSPEQCRGLKVDRRADVYAVGCLLYECLSGEAPFVGKNAIDTLSMHLKSPVQPIGEKFAVPKWLEAIVQKSLQKEPEKRYQSIDDLGAELQDGLAFASRSK